MKYALLTYASLSLSVIALAVWLGQRAALRRRVFSNLDSAAENGYFAPGEHCDGMAPEDLAHDLTCYSADFGGDDAKRLEPYVRSWMISRGLL